MAKESKQVFYMVRIKGIDGVKGEKSLTTLTSAAYKVLLRQKEERDRAVAEGGPGYHFKVKLDDIKVFKSIDEIPKDLLKIKYNAQDQDLTKELEDENAKLKAELEALKAGLNTQHSGKEKGKNAKDKEGVGANDKTLANAQGEGL